jgi:alpha-L-arabinofuranosidase
VVNTAPAAIETEITLDGARNLASSAEGVVLTSGSPKDENTLDAPFKVSPKAATFAVKGNKIKHAFPGNSFTVLRVKSGGK